MKKSLYHFVVLYMVCTSNYLSAEINDYFAKLKKSRSDLKEFLYKMPKGGELHYHYSGSSYPDELIELAKEGEYYIDPKTFKLSSRVLKCLNYRSKDFFSNTKNNQRITKAWSMFDLNVGLRARHDHFFSIFGKTGVLYSEHYNKLLGEMIRRAGLQNELYMEIILSSLAERKKFGLMLKNSDNLDQKKMILLNDKNFQQAVAAMAEMSSNYLNGARSFLECDKNSLNSGCSVQILFQSSVLRETPINEFFAQALAAFLSASKSTHIVGVNIVQPENGFYAKRDFIKHMRIFNYLHKKFPNVHIALHAGELDHKTNKKEDLCCHINQSVYLGKAERIGHGVDILFEDENKKLMKYMSENGRAVEINLTSNKEILSIEGRDHPLLTYLKNKVPVVLSTDDEGILGADLTEQYVIATSEYDLDYPAIKNINRNALTYSFLPGKSLWLNNGYTKIASECEIKNSKVCLAFLEKNRKARVQMDLEKKLSVFEQSYH